MYCHFLRKLIWFELLFSFSQLDKHTYTATNGSRLKIAAMLNPLPLLTADRHLHSRFS